METFNEGWNYICQYLKQEGKMTSTAYNAWIARIEPVSIDYENSEIKLLVPNNFHKQTILHGYMPILNEAIESVFGTTLNIVLISQDEIKNDDSDKNIILTGAQSADAGYEFTFDTFIVGSSNKFAHAACLAVAQNPAKSYNPLFIYGNSGLGKTHLLYAIGNEIKKNNPDMNVIYIKSEDFANQIIESIRTKSTNVFREKYRKADVLLVDDVQFIGGKEAVQTEFFHTFDALYDGKRQIVLTSDRPPRDIKDLTDRIKGRFEEGLIADIQPPDFETRVAIIQRKAEIEKIEISESICESIANKLKTNIRQLEGIVKKIKARYLLTKEPPTLATVNDDISDLLNNDVSPKITVEKIINEVARTYGVQPEDIRSQKSRRAEIALPRKIAIYIVRELTDLSMEKIGKEFGNRHYTTIVYTDKEVRKQIKTDPEIKNTIEDIIKNIREQ